MTVWINFFPLFQPFVCLFHSACFYIVVGSHFKLYNHCSIIQQWRWNHWNLNLSADPLSLWILDLLLWSFSLEIELFLPMPSLGISSPLSVIGSTGLLFSFCFFGPLDLSCCPFVFTCLTYCHFGYCGPLAFLLWQVLLKDSF